MSLFLEKLLVEYTINIKYTIQMTKMQKYEILKFSVNSTN